MSPLTNPVRFIGRLMGVTTGHSLLTSDIDPEICSRRHPVSCLGSIVVCYASKRVAIEFSTCFVEDLLDGRAA